MIEETSVYYIENQHQNGIISYFLKNVQSGSDLFTDDYITIKVPSFDQFSTSNPNSIFGINNPDYSTYYSTSYDEENKYILFDFHQFSISLNGVSIKTGQLDWFDKYHVHGSYDNIKIDDSRTIITENPYSPSWKHFPFAKMKPSRYINISVIGNSVEHKTNFAIYGMEFFGDIEMTARSIICRYCANSNPFNSIKLSSIFQIMMLNSAFN